MKITHKTILLLLVVAVLSGLIGYAVGADSSTGGEAAFSRRELRGCEISVHNVTCSTPEEEILVTDPDFAKKVIDLCLTAEKFRPLTTRDINAGGNDTYIHFKNEAETYHLSFSHPGEQLELDQNGSPRDNPVVFIGKTVNGDKASLRVLGWYCTMPAAAYAQLYESVERYPAPAPIYW